ncbi:ABC transporter ATP-binding protein [Anaerocolumna chitinilytica]|uniref:Daunorubicin resistance protein DrrA family ABC transporter ATP-binding protein n=1 Tax=Anaerocolumna chitinilytica TaxID=1727145 RepID=A0A7I8DLG4_9FIRM|nr:ABC transporter ATP-binding protein [Anaerocolumna chitinilytica]BCJ99219.1 daunorubicin resistance protein DrrA family ABC transporter ATP-binding protein [Anaerocolumna chitinilytica]
MNNIIEVRRFSKSYGDFKAVDDISFDVKAGEIFAFLGPNGAGKSTTINTLCTILDKTNGIMMINGHDVAKEKEKVRKDIGIVFQDSTLDARLTVEENLRFHCHFYKVPKNQIEERINFVLELVELSDWKKVKVAGLSGGMKRRVEIARGLVHYPKVLFLDEPTTGLDPQTRANVWEYIRRLQKQKNITIFLTTHYMDEAEICSNVAIMDHGKIIAYDTPENLKKQYTNIILQIDCKIPEEIEDYLNGEKIAHEIDNRHIIINTAQPSKALDLLTRFKDNIVDFEVKKGTLNEVFLAITGKEIRA